MWQRYRSLQLTIFALASAVVLGACAPKRVHESAILRNGDRVGSADIVIEQARADALLANATSEDRGDELLVNGLAECVPAVCDALARGELALGMTMPQVMAATGTTDYAWRVRQAGGGAAVMVPSSLVEAPRDAVSEVALVQLRDGQVAAYSYAEAAGLRVVSSQADATVAGRAAGLAELLLREGDDYVARGDLGRALDRYDRAQILQPSDPTIDFRIATVLDKQLRPIEALIRYRLFLHQLELERIDAVGSAWAGLADAIAQARQRVLILERDAR